MHQSASGKGRRHHIERGRKRDGIDPQQDRNQQDLSAVGDAVPVHRFTIAKIGEQESPRRLLRLPAQVAETCRQQDIVSLQYRGSKRHEHDQDEAQSHGEQDRVPKQAGTFVVIRDAQSDGQRIGDERVVDRSQKKDGAEKESEFSVVLFAERAGEQDH